MWFIVIGALIIGLTLGVLGSGGSILTVPVLTYLLGHNSKAAIAESLAIVGAISIVAVFPYARSKQVDWRSVVFFGVPGMIGAYFGAWLSEFVSGEVQLTLFALVMLAAAWMMARKPQGKVDPISNPLDENVADSDGLEIRSAEKRHSLWKIGAEGLAVGVITGLVGVGGGFLIVPALVLLGGLPMRVAIGTSLAVIALKSLSGFYKYMDVLETVNVSIEWWTVAAFIVVGVIGSIMGKLIAARINQRALQQGFAVFLLVMGLFVLGKEVPNLMTKHENQNTQAAMHSGGSRILTVKED